MQDVATSPAKPLTTTHLSLMCLLSARPWSAYELVGQMKRSVGLVWPRAQSNIYADLKTLAERGFAVATDESTGKRPRTVYRLSPKGKRELKKWLESPGSEPSFECEALVKLAFAPATTKDATLIQIEVMRSHAAQRLVMGRMVAEQYLEGAGLMNERLHISAIMWRFLWEQATAIETWAEWARDEVAAWPDTQDSPAGRERALESMRYRLDGTRSAKTAVSR